MQLKYADDLGKHQNCPPSTAIPHAKEAFRFVFATIEDGRNFLPVAKLTPQRKLRPQDHCVAHALSMYVTRQQAIDRYRFLSSGHENFYKTAGDHLARGVMCADDGHGCHYHSNGHFSFFESETANLSTKFSVLEKPTE